MSSEADENPGAGLYDSDLISQLARFVATAPDATERALTEVIRDSVIDTFGCILVGADEEVARLCRAALGPVAAGESPVYGSALRARPESAAFLNAVAGHALDMDDWEIPGNSHASVVMLPALLAAADGPLPAESLCDAYVMGFEVIARLGEAINFDHYARGWHTTGTLASIGAAAAISRLWRLDAAQTANAISLAVSRAAGLTRQFGSHAKALQAGFAAENGLGAARLARAGLSGQTHVLEGDQGYFALTAHADHHRYRIPFTRLGKRLALDEYGQVLKPYSSCGYTHRIIDCARQFYRDGIEAGQIKSIRIELPDFHAAILPFRQPQNRREALFSLPFCAAMGLLHGDLSLSDLDGERWKRPEVKALIAISEISPFVPTRPQLNYDPAQPDRLTLELNNGERIVAEEQFPRGAPQNPLSLDEVMEKFVSNANRFAEPAETDLASLRRWTELDDLLPLLYSIGVET